VDSLCHARLPMIADGGGFPSEECLSNGWAIWSLLGLSHLEKAYELRVALQKGRPVDEVLEEADGYGLHPLSIVVAAPPIFTDPPKMNFFGNLADSASLNRQNRHLARRLGIERRWFPFIRGMGLQLEGSHLEELPDGLAVPYLRIIRSGGIKAFPLTFSAASLWVEQCHGLSSLPMIPGLRELHVLDCLNVRALPARMRLTRLHLAACPGLDRLPPLQVCTLKLANCPMVELSEGMNLGRLSLRGMALLERLPGDLEDLDRASCRVEKCPRLKVLPWDDPPSPTALAQAFSKAGLANQT